MAVSRQRRSLLCRRAPRTLPSPARAQWLNLPSPSLCSVAPQSKRTSVTLLNDYIVLGALGKGAYGSVKLCYSMQDDNLYALKVLHRTQLKRQMLGPRRAPSGGGDALEMLRWGECTGRAGILCSRGSVCEAVCGGCRLCTSPAPNKARSPAALLPSWVQA